MVTSQTVLPPDQPATVYVNLISTCGGAIVKQCHPSFPIAGFLTMEEKCCALVHAIQNDPQCQAAGYCVSINDCLQNRKFKVMDSCPGAVLSMGISNNPAVFSQEGPGPIPDYEEEIITPGCTDPDGIPGNADDIVSEVNFHGPATGQPIAPGEPPHVEMDVTGGPTAAHAEVTTFPGEPATQVAAQLAQQLNQQGVPAALVRGGRSIQIKQPAGSRLAGGPIGVGVGTSDDGITADSQIGPSFAEAIPTLSEWGFILAMTLLLGVGAWKLLRR